MIDSFEGHLRSIHLIDELRLNIFLKLVKFWNQTFKNSFGLFNGHNVRTFKKGKKNKKRRSYKENKKNIAVAEVATHVENQPMSCLPRKARVHSIFHAPARRLIISQKIDQRPN